MKLKFCSILIIAFALYYNCFGQIRKSTAIFKEVDSINSISTALLKVNLASAKQIASTAKKLSFECNYELGYIQSICIISYVNAATNDCRGALKSLEDISRFSVKSNNNLGKGLINSAKGLCYYYLSIYDSAKIFHEQAIEQFILSNDYVRLTHEYHLLAKVYLKYGDSKKAGFYHSKAVEVENKFPDVDNYAWNLDMLGELYHAQRLFDKAVVEQIKSQKAFEKLNNQSGLASALLHNGNSYYMKMVDDSALICYNSSLEKYQKLGDSIGIAICYANLSRIALEQGNHQSAIDLANKSVSTVHGGDYKIIETAILQQLGDIYSELGQNEKAVQHINNALAIAKQINHKVSIMDCYKSLSEIYSSMKQPNLSYTNLLLAYRLKDSIQPVAFSKQLAEMQDQIETQKRENQITILEQSNKIKSLEISEQSYQIANRNAFIVFGILILTLIGIVINISTQKQKLKISAEKKLAIKETEENERLRFARDVHDDLGSGLTKINFLSELIIAGKATDSIIRENASGISETSKALIENMRDLIWSLNTENSTLENLLVSIREYAADYLEEFPAALKLNFPDVTGVMTITKESHREIFMTIKECLNNIVKHSKAERIEITASINNNLLYISVVDEGVGMKADEAVLGNGLKNMRNRINSIGGAFSSQSEPGRGTVIIITIGLEKLIKIRN